ELGLWRELDLAESFVGGRLVQESRLDGAEASLLGEQCERLGHERLGMREVGEVVPQRDRRERVDRLGDEDAIGTELRVRELEQPDELRRRQVLHDLREEDPAERSILERLQRRE